MLGTAAGYGILTPGRYIQADSNFINGGDLGYGTLLNFGTTVVTGGTTNSPPPAQAITDLTTFMDYLDTLTYTPKGTQVGGDYTPDNYSFTGSSVNFSTNLTLNGEGIYVFKINITSGPPSSFAIFDNPLMTSTGVSNNNIYFYIVGSTNFSNSNPTVFNGNFISRTVINVNNDQGTVINGRFLSNSSNIRLDNTTINVPTAVCYLKNTKILSKNFKYCRIEDLKIGDIIMSFGQFITTTYIRFT